MKRFLRDPRWPDLNRHASSSGIKILLGLDPKAKLPRDGMPAREVQGIIIGVLPLDPRTSRRRVHRVYAVCPDCSKQMSAGRLHQHICQE
jgi:hypothetical protein